jgi:hypothetical protein
MSNVCQLLNLPSTAIFSAETPLGHWLRFPWGTSVLGQQTDNRRLRWLAVAAGALRRALAARR